jgi:hypothetical protein
MKQQDTLVVGGVDAHADTHHAAALDERGALLAAQRFPTTTPGYRELLWSALWVASTGTWPTRLAATCSRRPRDGELQRRGRPGRRWQAVKAGDRFEAEEGAALRGLIARGAVKPVTTKAGAARAAAESKPKAKPGARRARK